MGVNSLPKTVTRQRRGCVLNPGPSAPESSTLTARLPKRPADWEYSNCRQAPVVSACTVLFVSISQVIGCEDRLRNDLYCGVGQGVKLYSNQTKAAISQMQLRKADEDARKLAAAVAGLNVCMG